MICNSENFLSKTVFDQAVFKDNIHFYYCSRLLKTKFVTRIMWFLCCCLHVLRGDVAALERSHHTISYHWFERTIQQTQKQWLLSLKTIAAVFYKANENRGF